MYRWWSMRNEEACTLTVEGEDVLEDVVLDVADPAARDGAVGVEERGAAEQHLELGVAADELQPHPLGVVEESELAEIGEVRDQALVRVLAHRRRCLPVCWRQWLLGRAAAGAARSCACACLCAVATAHLRTPSGGRSHARPRRVLARVLVWRWWHLRAWLRWWSKTDQASTS